MIARLWRSFRFWMRNLWRTFAKPTVKAKPFSRSYMRKAWAGRLRKIDREVEHLNRASSAPLAERLEARGRLLMERKLMVSKRRACRFD